MTFFSSGRIVLPVLFFLSLSAHALSEDGKQAVDGAARAMVVSEKCSGRRSTPEQAQADIDKIVDLLVRSGYGLEEVKQSFGAYAMRADLSTPAHPSAKDCRDAARIMKRVRTL
jgi:hypothetical protein